MRCCHSSLLFSKKRSSHPRFRGHGGYFSLICPAQRIRTQGQLYRRVGYRRLSCYSYPNMTWNNQQQFLLGAAYYMHNLVIEAIFTRFPDVRKEHARLTADGFEAVHIAYDTLKLMGHESIDITLTNGVEQHHIVQQRGYDGGFSNMLSKRM